MRAAAWARSMASGTATNDSAGTTTWLANPPNPQNTSTRSPTDQSVTPGPTAAMVPATSLPGTNGVGGFSWYRPWQISPSTKLTPAAATSTTTIPSDGSGMGRSSSTRVSRGPNSLQTTARMPVNLPGPPPGEWGRRRSGPQTAQASDHARERSREGLDIAVRGRPADRQPQRPFTIDAHGLEDRRGLEGLRRAGGAGMDGHPGLVQAQQDRLGLHTVDAEAHDVRHPPVGVAVGVDGVDRGGRVQQMVGAPAGGRGLGVDPSRLGQDGRRRTESDGASHVLQAGPTSPLLLAPHEQRVDPEAPAHDQCTHAGRATELVGGHRYQVGAETLEVERLS